MPSEGEIVIQFGNETYRGNYIDDLQIDEARLNEALAQQPSRYVWWSGVALRARSLWEEAKLVLERYDSQLYTFIRSDREGHGEKVTERAIESSISLDPRHQELHMNVLRLRLQYDHLDSVRSAFEMRLNMLMSLSANLRVEWNVNPNIREGVGEVATRRLRARVGEGMRDDARARAALGEL